MIEKEMIPEAQKNSPEENENGKNPSKPYRCEVKMNLSPILKISFIRAKIYDAETIFSSCLHIYMKLRVVN